MNNKSKRCRYVYQEGDRYYKYRENKQGELEKVIRYRQFIEGNRLQ